MSIFLYFSDKPKRYSAFPNKNARSYSRLLTVSPSTFGTRKSGQIVLNQNLNPRMSMLIKSKQKFSVYAQNNSNVNLYLKFYSANSYCIKKMIMQFLIDFSYDSFKWILINGFIALNGFSEIQDSNLGNSDNHNDNVSWILKHFDFIISYFNIFSNS